MLPKLSSTESKPKNIKVFSGLDRRDKISDSALTETLNMSSSATPALSTRESRMYIAGADDASEICAPEYTGGELTSFTGVRANKFFYNGTEIEGTLCDGKKSIADFNGKICIFPDKVYYDYIPDSDTGDISLSLVSMEKSLTVSNSTFRSSYDENEAI